jgi:Na+-driven multidrug efflux pump
LSLAIVFITAAGILLAQELNSPVLIWSIPVASIMVGLFTVVMIYRELRRKAYERA